MCVCYSDPGAVPDPDVFVLYLVYLKPDRKTINRTLTPPPPSVFLSLFFSLVLSVSHSLSLSRTAHAEIMNVHSCVFMEK